MKFLLGVMQRYVDVCRGVQRYIEMHRDMQGCAEVCTGVQRCTQGMQRCMCHSCHYSYRGTQNN